MNVTVLVLLAFALVFACIEAWKGATTVKPTSFGWLSIAVLIFVTMVYRGWDVFIK